MSWGKILILSFILGGLLVSACDFGGDETCVPDTTCVNTITVTFVDENGAAVNDVTGRFTYGGLQMNFDCTDENSLTCTDNILTLADVVKESQGILDAASASQNLEIDDTINLLWSPMEISEQGCNPECQESNPSATLEPIAAP